MRCWQAVVAVTLLLGASTGAGEMTTEMPVKLEHPWPTKLAGWHGDLVHLVAVEPPGSALHFIEFNPETGPVADIRVEMPAEVGLSDAVWHPGPVTGDLCAQGCVFASVVEIEPGVGNAQKIVRFDVATNESVIADGPALFVEKMVVDLRETVAEGCPDGCIHLVHLRSIISRLNPTTMVSAYNPGSLIGGPVGGAIAPVLIGSELYGIGGADPDEEVNGAPVPTREIWRIEPYLGSWERVDADLEWPVKYAEALWTGEEVLIVGGMHLAGAASNYVQSFDPVTSEIERVGYLPWPWIGGAAVWDTTTETAFLIGGWRNDQLTDAVARFDPRNQLPEVSAVASRSVVEVGDTVTFSATASDEDGTIESYAWSFGATGQSATHAFSSAGQKTVTVTVTDDDGGTGQAQVTVTVEDPPPPPPPPPPSNEEPSAALTCEQDFLEISCDASGSSDPDGDSLSYAWRFGDGSSASGVAVDHAYAAGGSYTVEVTVDDGEASDSASTTVHVEAPDPPVARLALSASSLLTGESVVLDASDSSPGEGTLRYAWRIGGGAFAVGSAQKTVSFAESGSVEVAVRVTNSEGLQDQASARVQVESPPPDPSTTTTTTATSSAPTTTTAAPSLDGSDDQESPAAFVGLLVVLIAVALRRR